MIRILKKLLAAGTVTWKREIRGSRGVDRFLDYPLFAMPTDEERMFLDEVVGRFADSEVKPWIRRIADNEFPDPLLRKMGSLGITGAVYPEAVGGSNLRPTAWVYTVERIASVSPSVALILNVAGGLGIKSLFLLGTDEQKARWLLPALRGEKIGAFGLTSPESGSDAISTKTRLTRKDGRLVLNGKKQFITLGGVADFVIVFARSENLTGSSKDRLAAVVVERGATGFMQRSETYRKMGHHGTDTSTLFFDDVEIPASHVLGDLESGIPAMLETLMTGRITISAIGLGILRTAFTSALKYAKEREQFGRPIGSNQSIQEKIARLLELYLGSRGLVLQAAAIQEQGGEFYPVACLAKKATSLAASEAAILSRRIHGGMGYIEEPIDDVMIATLLGDAELVVTGEGTPEMQDLAIARSLGLSVT